MSGGVDSSVSAALLKRQGYDVTGIFIKVWQPDFLPCNWKEERREAMRACAHLDIPFLTLDLEKEYKREVVDYMIDEYKKGRTPNPDVMCNRHVKFGGFFDFAVAHGADHVATGHYARINQKSNSKIFNLLKGKDTDKDQSYFLWTLTQRQLSKTLFPVGNMRKSEVRKLAKKFKLPNADKKDSQGLCFVGKIDMKEFLSHYIDERQGDVIDENGKIIGRHQGALFYTIGERHGFEISSKRPNDAPHFVIAKDVKKNTITVSFAPITNPKEKTILNDTNWIVRPKKENLDAKIRYRGTSHSVAIEILPKHQALVSFNESVEKIASGQSIVVYDKDICIGGGIVE